ncbi:hypothetical protein K7432_000183 [Basidiobolus ranarum]|uniref:FAD-binding domain-containing protein n=1 Tax=Basidiobolus ranarum TaxID=34480 RepID=A0ABR2X4Y6_9FUNG
MPSNTSSASPDLRIAIIGGGLGGLTLARILQTRGISSVVFERELSVNSRPQGGTLDIHTESGQAALKAAELFEEFERFARYEGQDLYILDKTGKAHIKEVTSDHVRDRPEIDRSTLREILVNSLANGVVRWGSYVKSIRSEQKGKSPHIIQLEDGSEETFDLVIGADGTWSRVRPLLSNATPTYTGVSFVECRLSDVEKQHPDQVKLVGRGSMMALSDNKGLMAQRNGDGSIRVYVALRVAEDYLSHQDFSTSSNARTFLLDIFPDWDESLKDLIHRCDNNHFTPRLLYSLPIEHHWETYPGVTLLGDAAHVMSPFAGEGANLAMLDAADLASEIVKMVKAKKDPKTCLQDYEALMLERASKAALESATNCDICISSDAPLGFVKLMKQYSSNNI